MRLRRGLTLGTLLSTLMRLEPRLKRSEDRQRVRRLRRLAGPRGLQHNALGEDGSEGDEF
eukprot:1226455-Prorocentrum_lima.AAC.1